MDVPIEYYFIALSALIGFVTVKRGAVPIYLRRFPYFLLVVLVNEIVSWQLGERGINNSIPYNFFSVGAFAFYMYMLGQMVFSRLVRKWILIIAAVFVTAAILCRTGLSATSALSPACVGGVGKGKGLAQ